jgi:hypothetical protein
MDSVVSLADTTTVPYSSGYHGVPLPCHLYIPYLSDGLPVSRHRCPVTGLWLSNSRVSGNNGHSQQSKRWIGVRATGCRSGATVGWPPVLVLAAGGWWHPNIKPATIPVLLAIALLWATIALAARIISGNALQQLRRLLSYVNVLGCLSCTVRSCGSWSYLTRWGVLQVRQMPPHLAERSGCLEGGVDGSVPCCPARNVGHSKEVMGPNIMSCAGSTAQGAARCGSRQRGGCILGVTA